MSILLDRLVGYDVNDEIGKTKLGIHPFMDAVGLFVKGWSGAPTPAELNAAFNLKNQTFDQGNTQVADALILIGLPAASGAAKRTSREIEQVLRLAEYFPGSVTKQRVEDMLGVKLST